MKAIVDRSISPVVADPWQPKPTVHDVRLSFAVGCESFQQGDYATAIDAFEKCVDLDPTYADAYACLGETYMWLGQHAPAIEAFRKALRINPDVSVRRTHLFAVDVRRYCTLP